MNEAIMASANKEEALKCYEVICRLYHIKEETLGVLTMYEDAAAAHGATDSEIDAVFNRTKAAAPNIVCRRPNRK